MAELVAVEARLALELVAVVWEGDTEVLAVPVAVLTNGGVALDVFREALVTPVSVLTNGGVALGVSIEVKRVGDLLCVFWERVAKIANSRYTAKQCSE